MSEVFKKYDDFLAYLANPSVNAYFEPQPDSATDPYIEIYGPVADKVI